MKMFKSIMRGIVSTILFVVIFFGLLVWTGEGILGVGNFFTRMMWAMGVFIASALIWLFWMSSVVWLTDGKWDLDEEGSEDED